MKLEFAAIKGTPAAAPINTAVFIDYESLYISFQKQYSSPPPLNEILTEIKSNGKIHKIKAFGDFTKPELSQERNRIRTITSEIIDCGSEATVLKKDFTDFIMLDHIYQEVIQNTIIEQLIFFTGDGHFSSAATFMRTFMDKTVGVYAVYGSLSRQLRDCSSWTKEIRAKGEDDIFYQTNLIRNLRGACDKGLIATFMKTVEHTQRAYGGDLYRYEQILGQLISTGYISNEMVTSLENREFRMLVVDWEKVEKELTVRG